MGIAIEIGLRRTLEINKMGISIRVEKVNTPSIYLVVLLLYFWYRIAITPDRVIGFAYEFLTVNVRYGIVAMPRMGQSLHQNIQIRPVSCKFKNSF